MINEGGKWAHVVLRKCVFEPKAAGISSLMHQPSTGHLRSTVCCAVSSVPAERRCIDSPKNPSHLLTFFLFGFSYFSHVILYVLQCISCNSFTPPFFHLITPSPASLFPRILNLSSSSFLFLRCPAASLGFHTLHNSISVFCVCFLPLCDLGSFLALERWPTLNPRNTNTEQSFNRCDSWHHRLVWYISERCLIQ